MASSADVQLCRACAEECVDAENIYATQLQCIELAQMLAICGGIYVAMDDGLSSVICVACMGKLEFVYDFRQMCHASEQKLRNIEASIVKSKFLDQESDIVSEPNEPFHENALVDEAPPSDELKKSNQCTVCDKVFDRPSKLRRHSNVHASDAKPFECATCHKRFQDECHLIRHKVMHSDEMAQSIEASVKSEQQSHKCRECDREFAKQASLAAHMKIHARNGHRKSFECSHCSKTFPLQSKLSRHQRIHNSNRKKFVCSMENCERSFSSSGHLIDHLNRHKEVRPYICDICNKGNFGIFHLSCILGFF